MAIAIFFDFTTFLTIFADMNEASLQRQIISTFRANFPKYAWCLFAIENKRKTDKGYLLKSQGVLSGVADLCLALPTEKHGALYIELKFGKNKQTESQLEFEREMKMHGNNYVLCYTLHDAIDNILNHINEHQKWKQKS